MARAIKRAALFDTNSQARAEPLPSGIEGYVLTDDGVIPNNSKLPVVVYRQALAFPEGMRAPERAFEALFTSNGWIAAWINGIYAFHHYHSTAHEVLGLSKGFAAVQFGGAHGPIFDLCSGDAVVIPAGVGHCLLREEDLVVVGAYPEGQDWDLCRATQIDRARALENIPWVRLPALDPVFGASGPVIALWHD